MAEVVLVTGATGFVGTHLVAAIKAQGRRVVAAGSGDGDIASSALTEKYQGDDIEHVVHLAAKSFVPDSWNDPRPFYRTNVLGTVNVLELCRQRTIALTYVSSYVYGPPRSLPIDEDHPLAPFNPYSHTKILAEEAVAYYGERFGVAATVIRPFNVYGPGQNARFLVPSLIRQALDPSLDRITVRDIRPRRDFVHVADLVALLCATIDRPVSGVFNAGSGSSSSIAQVVDRISAATGSAKPLASAGEERPDEIFDVVADISRASRRFGWAPRIGLDEGLRDTVRWMQGQLAAAR